ncbi:MAG: hypothetical protein ACOYW4_10040, partial [Bacillota bacterium]
MKRITLGTVALLGVLAVVTVKLPSVLVDPRFRGYSAVSSRGRPLALSQDLKPVTPLVVAKGVPSLPPLEPGPLDSLDLRAAPRDLGKTAGSPPPEGLHTDASPLPSLGDPPGASVSEPHTVEHGIRPQEVAEPQQATGAPRQVAGAQEVPAPRETGVP